MLAGPMMLGLAVFYVYPIGKTLYFSFTRWGIFGGQTWIGLDNYLAVFRDPEFFRALGNTVVYAAAVLIAVPLAMVLATFLNAPRLRGRAVYRVLYFLPVITMPVAAGLIWRLLLNGDFGYVNAFLRLFGVQGPAWLSNPNTALISLALVGIWTALGYNIVLLLAGLQSIPTEMYEAASLDGAGPVRQFFEVTVPLLSPTTFFVTVVSIIGSLQMFDLVYVMVGANSPYLPQTETIIFLFYRTAFIDNNKGLASAIVFLLLLLIVGLTAIQFRLQRRWVHYE